MSAFISFMITATIIPMRKPSLKIYDEIPTEIVIFKSPIKNLEFSPDSSSFLPIYLSSNEPQFITWNGTGTQALLYEKHKKEIQLYDAQKKINSKVIKVTDGFKNASFSPDDQKIIIAFTDKKKRIVKDTNIIRVQFHDIETNTVSKEKEIELNDNDTEDLLFLKSSGYILCTTKKNNNHNSAILFDLDQSKEIITYKLPVLKISKNKDGSLFSLSYSSAGQGTTEIYSLNNPKKPLFKNISNRIPIFTGDGSYAVLQETHFLTYIYDLKNIDHRPIDLLLDQQNIQSPKLDPTNTYFTIKVPNYIYVYDFKTMKRVQELLIDDEKERLLIHTITFSPDGKKMAVIFLNNTVKIYKRHEAPLNVTKERIKKLENAEFLFK